MRTMTTSSFAGSGDRDARGRDSLFRRCSGLLFSADFLLSRTFSRILHLTAPLYRDLQGSRLWGAPLE